jgi:uroporphyrinogen-III decarboxylase
MTPKERIIAALEHREADRVPVGEMAIDFEMTERVLGRETLYRSKWKEYTALWEGRRDRIVDSYVRDIVDLVRHFDLDYLAVPLVPARKDHYEPPEMVGPNSWRDANGMVWEYSPESGGHAMVVEPLDLSADDIVMPTDPAPVDSSRLEAIERIAKELGGSHFIMARVPDGAFPWQESLGTMDGFLMKMIDDPAFVERAVEANTRLSVAYAQAALDAGADAVSPDGDFCDNRGPVMGPDLFHRYCAASVRRQAEAIHAKGGFDVKHCDGNTWAILDDFVAAGVDGWQGIQPRIGMDLAQLKERYGDRLCLFGGVDVDTLVAGSQDDVAAQVRYAIEHASAGGGLVIGSGNTIMPGVRLENFTTMLRTAREAGAYGARVDARATGTPRRA